MSAVLCRRQWLDSAHGNSGAAAMLAEAAAEEAAAAAALGVRRVGAVEDLRCLEENLDTNVERRYVLTELTTCLEMDSTMQRMYQGVAYILHGDPVPARYTCGRQVQRR